MQADISNREKQISEWQALLNAKNQEYAAATNKSMELSAAKGAAEAQVEPTSNAMKVALEAQAALQSRLDLSNMAVVVGQAELALWQNELARFAAAAGEMAARRTAVEQSMTQSLMEKKPMEQAIAVSQAQLDQATQEVVKLEQQIAALQAMVSTANGNAATLQQALAAQRQSLNAIQSRIDQSEADLANADAQLQLFEQAYKKR
jgi:chromosome segregation ATPase